MFTYYKLGVQNLVWIAFYRIILKLGFFTKNMPIKAPILKPIFIDPKINAEPEIDSVELLGFGWIEVDKHSPPVWDRALSSNIKANSGLKHWSQISDFSLNVGDIKTIWELSRFDWLISLCVEYRKTGNHELINKINSWLIDWSKANPTNSGINWKCGQESSIRVLHLSLAALLLDQETRLSESFIEFLKQHLERISPTVLYAMAQDNNHGTSEATALYIGGLLLRKNQNEKLGKSFQLKGLYWLENRAKRLIENDGSFSQYSVNYHRVMLDSYCLTEIFRDKFEQKAFSPIFYSRLKAATNWLFCFTQKINGDVPNLGANDGAKLLPLSNTNYRDFRPTVQLASALFLNEFKYPLNGTYQQTIDLLKINNKLQVNSTVKSHSFSDGGFTFLKNKSASVYFRVPNFKFRPGQCDVFHVDLWLNGENILRDGGSFSYNTDAKWLTYFSGVESHNTIQFDDKNQMPKISRFLYGEWIRPKTLSLDLESLMQTSSYSNYQKIKHTRSVKLNTVNLVVYDELSGFESKAILRWRLRPGDWEIKENKLCSDDLEINITSSVDIKRIELVEGWESRFYLQKTKLPVVEVEINEPGSITTEIYWNN
jgi:hypothetical protein